MKKAMAAPNERDDLLEQWLRRGRQGAAAATESCLDAETAAAFVARGLTGASLEQAQAHLADCARCQAVIGVLVRADLGGQSAEPARDPRRWLGWLVPLTAAATASIAVALWVTLPSQGGKALSSAVQPAPAPQVAEAQAAPAPGALPPQARADERPSLTPAADALDRDLARGARAVPPLAKPEEPQAKSLSAARKEADAAPPAVAGVAAARGVAATSGASVALADAPAAVGAVARSEFRASAPAPFEFASPDRTVRWRLAGGGVERSMDSGATWVSVATGVTAVVTSGSAPSATTCWLAGRGGLVLVTTDGVSWRSVPLPEPADVATVSASDAQQATVTTTDGRTFRTTNSGVLWTR